MEANSAPVEAWLRDGGLVIAASDRARRALLAEYHRARRAEGLSAWPSPAILDWQSFVRSTWEERRADARLVLNSRQEQALWTELVGANGHSAAILAPSRRRLAAMAMDAHGLLCLYAPEFLQQNRRNGWQQDGAAFSRWLSLFEECCRDSESVSANRLPLELIPQIAEECRSRAPLMLMGFDRLLPVQKRLLDAWGVWREYRLPRNATHIRSYVASDAHAELRACARWCRGRLDADPLSRILVVTQDAALRRGEIERAFLHCWPEEPSRTFEFSLGVPLGSVGVARSAFLLLRWLTASIEERELDWLLACGYASAPQETSALLGYMRSLRRRGLQRTKWTMQAFLNQSSAATMLPPRWRERLSAAQQLLRSHASADAAPLDWAALIPQILEAAGWPGRSGLSSAEHQAMRAWQDTLEQCGSLGFDGRRMAWNEFLSEIQSAIAETLFAAESEDAPILIAGPAESAGLTADAIWFMGTDEDAWPARGRIHPLLPPDLQRDTAMPHASPLLDAQLAESMTARLLASADEVHFSYARQMNGVETRASRLIGKFAGTAQALPAELTGIVARAVFTEPFVDESRAPLSCPTGSEADPQEVRGGSTVLTAQSQCPFKAFATARLGAQGWEPAEAGLTAAQRGQLLHAVLHAIWGGPPRGIRSLEQLQQIGDVAAFVAGHVRGVIARELPQSVQEQMPERYLELEELRLARLITEWMEYEAARVPFVVAQTEVGSTIEIAGLKLKLRLDRVDRLIDGTHLVIDYKTGDVTPRSWDLPRPDDVQLPLYAGFALQEEELAGGLVFAKLRAGETCFAGRVGDAAGTLFPSLKGTSTLVKDALTAERLLDWREAIEQLARDFLAGRADVDPREHPQTCARCGLQTLCRVQEREPERETEDDAAEVTNE